MFCGGLLQLINVSHKLIDCAYAVGKFIRFFAAIAHGFLGRLAYLAHNLQRISALQRKAESVLYVHRVDDVSIVEPQFCRNEPFERFAFRVDSEGIPQLCDLPTESVNNSNDVCSLLSTYFGGSVERKVLTYRLMENYGLSKDTARMRIRRALDSGVVVQNGNVISLPTTTPKQPEAVVSAPEPTEVEIGDIFPNKPTRCPADWEDDVPF